MGSEQYLKRARREPRTGKVDALLDAKLKGVEWGEFRFTKLFKLLNIKNKFVKSELSNIGEFPVYSSETTNNGIIGYIKNNADFIINVENPIYVVFGDHTRSFNIATKSFSVADNVKVLTVLNKEITINSLSFILSSWKKCIPNKGYSRHWSLAKGVSFNLPTKNNKIDFEFMENFIAELEAQKIARLDAYLMKNDLKEYRLNKEEEDVLKDFESGNIEWDSFNLKELFGKSTRGKRLKSDDRISGDLPFVTAGETDEGVSAFIGNSVTIFPKNTTTIDMFGSAKYRNYEYGGDDHIAVVPTQNLAKHASIFVTTSIHKSAHTGEFDYGRNFYAKDADELNISLPTKNKQPDYTLMQTLISAIQKLVIKDVVLYLDKKAVSK